MAAAALQCLPLQSRHGHHTRRKEGRTISGKGAGGGGGYGANASHLLRLKGYELDSAIAEHAVTPSLFSAPAAAEGRSSIHGRRQAKGGIASATAASLSEEKVESRAPYRGDERGANCGAVCDSLESGVASFSNGVGSHVHVDTPAGDTWHYAEGLGFSKPAFSHPNHSDPQLLSPNMSNPNFLNSTLDVSNSTASIPAVSNPASCNPSFTYPSFPNSAYSNIGFSNPNSSHPDDGPFRSPVNPSPSLHIHASRSSSPLHPPLCDSTEDKHVPAANLLERVSTESGDGQMLREEHFLDLNPRNMPRHVAIIMDGNSRWAKRKGLPGNAGHEVGLQVLQKIVRLSATWGLKALTVFAFSTENWLRSQTEVSFLMGLFERAVQQELSSLHRENICVRFIGDIDMLPDSLQTLISEAHKVSAGNSGLMLNIAVSYSGRRDVTRACQQLAEKVKMGTMQPSDITEAAIEKELGTSWMGELSQPDLLIRTSGEQRLSNFLLWQTAYSELYFSPVCWPDFGEAEYMAAMASFQRRERRFGRRT